MLDSVVLLAAPTARSQAYLQGLAAAELSPATVVLLGGEDVSPTSDPASRQSPASPWPDLRFPDLSESLMTTCARAGVRVHRCESREVNSDEVALTIERLSPAVVIYSGYGGQIVGGRLLDLGPRFLHLHSGALPDYRGSTTLYYALLNGDLPSVSALMLDRRIDTGPIIERREYPAPPAGLDLDRVYDAAIRADLLARVMRRFAETGDFGSPRPQSQDAGTTYYVIHPVLKHLALLSLSDDGSSS